MPRNDLDRCIKISGWGDRERGMQLLIADHKIAGEIMTQNVFKRCKEQRRMCILKI